MRKQNAVCLAIVTVGLLAAGRALAGSLDPTNAPGPTMHTLEEIYQKLQSLDPDTQQILSDTTTLLNAGYYAATNLVQVDEDLAPGNIKAGTTIFGITGKPEVVDTTSGDAVAGDILSGKKVWVDGVEVSGTMEPQTISPASATVVSGYYAATNLTQVDADLTAENIRTNVTILGVTGTHADPSPYAAMVPKTGQTTPYQTGDDGTYQKGVSWPNQRFTIQANTNCVLDNMTGLIWARNANLAGLKNWSNAVVYCEDLDYGGQTDWRLPNHRELLSLIEYYQNHHPALPAGHPFTNVKGVDWYWSSSTYSTASLGYAWSVFFGYGDLYGYSKVNNYYVWPVRGGQ